MCVEEIDVLFRMLDDNTSDTFPRIPVRMENIPKVTIEGISLKQRIYDGVLGKCHTSRT